MIKKIIISNIFNIFYKYGDDKTVLKHIVSYINDIYMNNNFLWDYAIDSTDFKINKICIEFNNNSYEEDFTILFTKKQYRLKKLKKII